MTEENKPFATEEEMKSVRLKKLPDLKALREACGLTTEDLFLKTRISATILNAIENGEFYLLPAPAFTKKIIQIYAEAVGTDAEIILAHYQRYVDEKQAVPKEVKVVKEPSAFDRKPLPRFIWFAIPAVAIIASACIMYAFFHKNETPGSLQHAVTTDKRQQVSPKPAPAPAAPPPAAVATVPLTPPPAMVAIKETTQTPKNTLLNLLIEATEDTWLKITEDSNPPYQITLKTGEKLSRTAGEFFTIDVGNAAGVNITFLGKSLGSLGRKGQVVHLRLPQQ